MIGPGGLGRLKIDVIRASTLQLNKSYCDRRYNHVEPTFRQCHGHMRIALDETHHEGERRSYWNCGVSDSDQSDSDEDA